MEKIKFGTDGWRAIIAKEFTVANVARVAEGTAKWLLSQSKNPSIVLGHDCRFAGELFCDTVAKVMCPMGVKVSLAKDFVSTPMISLGAVKLKKDLGIIITASHNPPEYNGFKRKGSFGGPLQPALVSEIENLIPDVCTVQFENMELSTFENSGLLEYVNLEDMYVEHVKAHFDLEVIRKSGLHLAYDAMYGAGQNVMRRLLPELTFLHCEYNPSFMGQAPEPIHKNLTEFSNLIKNSGKIDSGLVTDGDADRLGFRSSRGKVAKRWIVIDRNPKGFEKPVDLIGRVHCIDGDTEVLVRRPARIRDEWRKQPRVEQLDVDPLHCRGIADHKRKDRSGRCVQIDRKFLQTAA